VATPAGSSLPVEITLTVPEHNLKVGDEFRIPIADDPDFESSGPDNFVVLAVNGDNITYRTGGTGSDPDPTTTAGGTNEVRRSAFRTRSVRDQFQSVKAALEQWEDQLDQRCESAQRR
jgi:hypothetical protein